VHAHSWNLVSYVLFGQLRNELPRVMDADIAAPGAWRVFEVRSHGDTDDIVPTQRLVRCDPGDSALAVRDDVYMVPAGTFHSTAAVRAVTVALGSTVAGATDLSLGDPATRSHRVRRKGLGPRETTALARRVIERYWRQP
jgi:hypothetical protein